MTTEIGTKIHDIIPGLIDELPGVAALNLIVHPASWNWRQEHRDPDAQFQNLDKGLKQTVRPMVEVPRRDVINSYLEVIRQIIQYFGPQIPNTVVSLCSRIITDGYEEEFHLPMMNYHPEGVGQKSAEGLDRVAKLLRSITNWDTFIVETDRYWHSYGKYLMSRKEWLNWMGLHANATSMVSPRYFGQSVRDGYNPLRQVGNPDSPVKNHVPQLVRFLPKSEQPPTLLEYQLVPINTPSTLLPFSWQLVGLNAESITKNRTSRVLIVNTRGQVLLTKRALGKSFGNMWHIPGGRADDDENPLDTARRGILEELGITLDSLTIFNRYYSSYNGGFDVTVFTALVQDNQLIQLDGTENSAYRWFSGDELPECAFSDSQTLKSFFSA